MKIYLIILIKINKNNKFSKLMAFNKIFEQI